MSGSEGHHGPTDERLADWVDGRLAPGERAAFEAWLAEDPARQADADAYRGTVEAVRGALRQGPHARLDFASRVLDAAASTPAAHDAARARRFAWVGSAAAALVFVTVFILVQRLNRTAPNAEDLALAEVPEVAGRTQAELELGFDGFFAGSSRDRGEERARFAVSAPEPEALQIESFLGGGIELPIPGGGGGSRGGAPAPGGILGIGGGRGGLSASSPASPGPVGPAGPASPSPRASGPGTDAPVAGRNDLFFRGASAPDATPDVGPIGALVYVVTWRQPEEREGAAAATTESFVISPPADPLEWCRSVLAQIPAQDNVIVLPNDLAPLDLGPARLALGAVAEAEDGREPGEYWPVAGDLAFRVGGDAAQRVRVLRTLLRAARDRGAVLGLQRSRFRRLDLRAEDGSDPERGGSDVVLVLRGTPVTEPGNGPASQMRK